MSKAHRMQAYALDSYVGRQVMKHREAAGLSQAKLSATLGLSQGQFTRYENGISRISAGRLHQIAAALGRKPNDFFPPIERRDDDERLASLVRNVASLSGDERALVADLASRLRRLGR